MYEIFPKGDWTPDKPNPGDDLWRYLDFPQYISILENQTLWFSPLSGFYDPFEGALPKKTLESLAAEVNDAVSEPKSLVAHMYDALRHTTYASCWHQRETETAAMWQLYKNSGKEIAIRTTVHDLKSALIAGENVVTGCVDYVDYDSPAEFAATRISPSFHKRPSFEYESEYRLVVSNFEVADGAPIDEEYADRIADNARSGIPVSVDPNKLIHEIVISPSAGKWLKSLTNDVTSKYLSSDVDVSRSKLVEEPFSTPN